jgi:hypothetical protein
MRTPATEKGTEAIQLPITPIDGAFWRVCTADCQPLFTKRIVSHAQNGEIRSAESDSIDGRQATWSNRIASALLGPGYLARVLIVVLAKLSSV